MGMVTHIIINNDCFSDILNDPEGFVDSIRTQMNNGGITPLSANGRSQVGWCSLAHHSSYDHAYANDHTRMVPVNKFTTQENVEGPTDANH